MNIWRQGGDGGREEHGELVELEPSLVLTQNPEGQPKLGVGNAGAGVSGFPLDVPAATPHACDDDFALPTLDSKWSTIVTANAMSVAMASGWMTMEPSASGTGGLTGKAWGIKQVAPSGDFTVKAKIANNRSLIGTNSYDGIMIGKTGGKGHVWGMGRNILMGLTLMSTNTYGEGGSDWAGFNGTNMVEDLARSVHFTWYRVRWNAAAGTLNFDYSQNGVFFTQWATLSGESQPDRIGLVMYAQDGNFHADKAMGADWFRVTEP